MSRIRIALRSYWLFIAPAFRASPGFMVMSTMLQIIGGVTFALYPLGLRELVDGVTKHNYGQLVTGIALFGGFSTTTWTLTSMGTTSSFGVLQRTDIYLTQRIAELVNKMPGIEHFERPDYLRELDLLNRNRRVLASAPQQFLGIVAGGVRTILGLVILVSVNRIFLLLPIVALIPFAADRYSSAYRQRIDNSLVEQVRLTNQLFTLTATAAPAKELRVFGLAHTLFDRHNKAAKEVESGITRAGVITFVFGALGWFLFSAVFILTIILVIVQAIDGHATAGQVLMSVFLAQNLQARVSDLAGTAGQLLQARKTAERYIWLEDRARAVPRSESPVPVPDRLGQKISIENLSFTYPGATEPVLKNISMDLAAGTTVAFVGDNGAGKTTLAKLIGRMYESTTGAIRVDDISIADFDIADWRGRIAAIFQDFGRYELRARDTVGIGDLPRITDESAVTTALQRAGSLDVIDSLENGLMTQLGKSYEGGRELSGGQWQKLALGRGRMRSDPLILILDEPTSSLDAPTEHAIFEQFVSAARDVADQVGAVTILISHRFSTVRMADLIVVMDQGQIVESGSHADLMSGGGMYAELFALQQRAYL